jgi:ribosomal protein S18 acetylase RimI-like enzyme
MRARHLTADNSQWDAPDYRIESWTPDTFLSRVDETMLIYVRAMQYPSHAGPQRAVSARKHADYVGFSCRVALIGEDNVIGFGYGYTTAAGQWWHDLVRQAIGREKAAIWLPDAFELSELHVLPSYQGFGIGRRVLTDLSAAVPNRTMLLSTPDADTRAFRMYSNLGFEPLRRQYLFPGDARPFAIMGSRLPLAGLPLAP